MIASLQVAENFHCRNKICWLCNKGNRSLCFSVQRLLLQLGINSKRKHRQWECCLMVVLSVRETSIGWRNGRSPVKFSKGNYKALCLQTNSPRNWHSLEADQWESSSKEVLGPGEWCEYHLHSCFTTVCIMQQKNVYAHTSRSLVKTPHAGWRML